jgi:hypothetical protein
MVAPAAAPARRWRGLAVLGLVLGKIVRFVRLRIVVVRGSLDTGTPQPAWSVPT